MEENLVIDFVGKVTDEDVEMVRCVFLGCVVRLVGPVNTDFLYLSEPPARSCRARLRCCGCGGR